MSLLRRVIRAARSLDPRVLDGGLALALTVWALTEPGTLSDRGRSSDRADRLEREQEASLRAERERIARELHDVVTHSVSVMVMQTGAARQIMGRDERRSRALLESVESSGRSALVEKYYARDQPDDLQHRERGLAVGAIQQTDSEWSRLIATLELAHRWRELLGGFTGEDAHP